MCGIAGWVGVGADEQVVRRMTRSVAHRGPDDELVVAMPGAALGVRRLSIVDRQSGKQPMELDGVWALLNGEIYNYDDLRNELEAGGAEFRTWCDTEVLLHLYQADPDGFLGRLNGMFGLALWDSARERLILARDPIGKRPLYYARVSEGVVFASELRAVRKHPGVGGELDVMGLRRYLIHDAVPSPGTILSGVCKLQPGETLTWDGGDIKRRTYWHLGFDAPVPSADGDALDALDALLRAATRRRMSSEVPVGCLLSGGIDSSLVALLAGADQPMQSFALGWDRPTFDESAAARSAAAAAGTEHHELILSDADITDLVPAIMAHMDEPLADESVVPTWCISRFARERVTVALTGDGGDELFLGYPTFMADRVATTMDKSGLSVFAGGLASLARRLPASTGQVTIDFQARRFTAGLAADRFRRHMIWLASVDPADQRRLLAPQVLSATRDQDPLAPVDEVAAELKGRARDDWDVLTGLYLRFFLGDGLLVKVDRSSMAHALEPRSPLLDRDVVAFAAALPRRMKLRRTQLKWALRRLAERRGLPSALVQAKKKGFSAPNADWLKGPLRPWMEDLLSPAALRAGGLFDPRAVEEMMREHVEGRVNHRKPLWAILAFRAWEQRWR